MKISIFGAGAWGTALAVNAASATKGADAGHQITLWTRDVAQAVQMQTDGVNARYLPSIPLPAKLQIAHGDIATHSQQADLCIIATPMSALRSMLLQLNKVTCPVVWLCKGFETAQDGHVGLLGHEIAAQVCPGDLRFGVLSGFPVLRWKWHAVNPQPWLLPANIPACAMPWLRHFTATLCVCTPMTM